MEQKNLLLICTDHWAGSRLGCAGHPVIMTPTLDRLAENGVRFTRYYSECPVCIPARRSMMTGLSPRRHGDRVYSALMEMPPVTTLAQAFRDAGYQAMAVGKLHVYPQRSRIGFDDVILQEEGRYEFGVTDDYETWLGEQGFVGQEFAHTLGNNTYHTRPWHLPEYTHPTTWATREMIRQIKRRDPTRPFFFYLSYQFPHPPLAPLETYWDMYSDEEIDEPVRGEWDKDPYFASVLKGDEEYSRKEMRRARRAAYAQCTHIDAQLRLLVGTLRECGLLENTVIAFTSDHGDNLFDHGLLAKRNFYEESACVPLILSGPPVWQRLGKAGVVDDRLGVHADLMPTLLDLCGVPQVPGMDGVSLLQNRHDYIFGEIGEGAGATRMAHDGRYKLIYYAGSNRVQLFDLETDPHEQFDLAQLEQYQDKRRELEQYLISQLHGGDEAWVQEGSLCGSGIQPKEPRPNFALNGQRGLHWPMEGVCRTGGRKLKCELPQKDKGEK